ncbi:MAG: hypothetical protein QOF01_958 [Thermomicrobiales bacterium]|nr:hypothetical protein [Thermomicrobiales bacterium]
MVPFLTILTVAVLVWRYRKVLGLDKRWDQSGRSSADDLAARLGWSSQRGAQRPAAASTKPAGSTGAVVRSYLPKIDSSRLPTALAIGVLVAVVALGLELQGFSLLASLVAILIGPIFGGTYVRSWWWPLVASVTAVIVGAGGELGLLIVAVPVAAIAYAGIRTDVAARIARWNAEPEDH